MNQERKEELIVRGMDQDVFSPSEKEELDRVLEAEPELKSLSEGHGQVRAELQAAFGQPGDVPYGDFFQKKLEQAIRNSEQKEAFVSRPSSSWRDALRWWLAPLAVGAMAVAFLAGTRVGKAPIQNRMVKSEEQRPVVYTPERGVTASVMAADASGTSVIFLEGLEPIPDSLDLMAGSRQNSKHTSSDVVLITTEGSAQLY